MNGGRPLRILTVCSFNRTRSVMTAAMLDSMLEARVGPEAAVVKSAGCVSPGYPAIPAADIFEMIQGEEVIIYPGYIGDVVAAETGD